MSNVYTTVASSSHPVGIHIRCDDDVELLDRVLANIYKTLNLNCVEKL